MPRDTLDTPEEEATFRAFQQYDFTGFGIIVGFWGIFRNEQLVPINGNWFYNRRVKATIARNGFIGTLIPVTQGEGYNLIGFNIVDYPDGSSPPDITCSSGENLVTGGRYNSYAYDIRENSPELFKRLSNLFYVRQIRDTDITPEVLRLMSSPEPEEDEEETEDANEE